MGLDLPGLVAFLSGHFAEHRDLGQPAAEIVVQVAGDADALAFRGLQQFQAFDLTPVPAP